MRAMSGRRFMDERWWRWVERRESGGEDQLPGEAGKRGLLTRLSTPLPLRVTFFSEVPSVTVILVALLPAPSGLKLASNVVDYPPLSSFSLGWVTLKFFLPDWEIWTVNPEMGRLPRLVIVSTWDWLERLTWVSEKRAGFSTPSPTV